MKNGMRRELKHAMGFEADARHTKRTNMLLQVNDPLGPVQKDHIDRKQHPDGVDAV